MGLAERCGIWIEWFGLSRLVASAAAVTVIVAGMWWLLHAPPVPAEQTLPHASGSSPSSTLSVPAGSAALLSSIVPPTVAEPSVLVVHVAGNVGVPGVYRLPPDARVADAIALAGGVNADADSNGLNLAAPLRDGERVYVPAVGEVSPGAVIAPDVASTPDEGGDGDPTAPGAPIDLNSADQDAFESLPGVGPATARAIIEDRLRNGPFASVEDLDRVPGIGPAKLASLRDLVTV